ncbi:MAG: M48 family metallopeptidase [Clostridia bacterium]
MEKNLFEQIQTQPSLLDRLGNSERLALLLSFLIIGFSAAGFLAGVYGLIRWYHSPFILLLFFMIMMISWLSRPRPNRLSNQVFLLQPDHCPQTYKILTTIEKELGLSKRIQYGISPHYEAYTTEIGWKRTPVVVLGYPLLRACTPEELTALVSHELAHCVNHDSRRSGPVAYALRILSNWSDMLDPSMHSIDTLYQILSKLLMRILYWIPYSLLFLLVHLFWNQSQRAEYKADRLAAKIAGSDAMISMLQTVHLDHIFEMVVGKHALQKQDNSLGDQLQETFSQVPEKEKTRVQHILERSNKSMDTTHPSTHYRIEMLRAHGQSPSHHMSAEECQAIRHEVNAQAQVKMERQMIDSYRARHF